MKAEGAIPRRVALCQCKYLNKVIDTGPPDGEETSLVAKGYGSFHSAWKGRLRWLAKGGVVSQDLFIAWLFGLPA